MDRSESDSARALPWGLVAASLIDTAFHGSDAGGRDPDRYSTTLRGYHQLLWGKPLPGGGDFDLDARLHHMSDFGQFWLSSDSIAHTYTGWSRRKRLVEVLAVTPSEEGRSSIWPVRSRLPCIPGQPYVDGKLQQTSTSAAACTP